MSKGEIDEQRDGEALQIFLNSLKNASMDG